MPELQALIEAVRSADLEAVRMLLGRDPGLSAARTEDGVSALMLALYHRRPDIADEIRRHRSEVDVFEAAALGEDDRVAELVRTAPSLVNAVASDGFCPLGLAAFFGRETVVDRLLAAGADPCSPARNTMRVCPLHSAAAHEDGAVAAAIARRLLDAGADVNAEQAGGFRALHAAARAGHTALVLLLLDRGADPEALAADGRVAGDFAREGGHDALAVEIEREAEKKRRA